MVSGCFFYAATNHMATHLVEDSKTSSGLVGAWEAFAKLKSSFAKQGLGVDGFGCVGLASPNNLRKVFIKQRWVVFEKPFASDWIIFFKFSSFHIKKTHNSL